jgi:ketosteroid isomerase-like protein
MRLALPTLAALAVVLAAACSPKRLPGTEISDNPDTRGVVAALEAYRQAAERRDPEAVMKLVSPMYFDDAGTPDPGDDVNYDQLRERITKDYAQVTALRLDIALKKVEIDGDKAVAYVFYDERYRIALKSGEVARQASDQHRMTLVRDGASSWKFTSGL